MTRRNIWNEIELELRAAKKKSPNWPDHVAAQAGIICGCAGNVMNDALDIKYDHSSESDISKYQATELMRRNAILTAVASIRFLENLK